MALSAPAVGEHRAGRERLRSRRSPRPRRPARRGSSCPRGRRRRASAGGDRPPRQGRHRHAVPDLPDPSGAARGRLRPRGGASGRSKPHRTTRPNDAVEIVDSRTYRHLFAQAPSPRLVRTGQNPDGRPPAPSAIARSSAQALRRPPESARAQPAQGGAKTGEHTQLPLPCVDDSDVAIRNLTYQLFVDLGRAPTSADVSTTAGATACSR